MLKKKLKNSYQAWHSLKKVQLQHNQSRVLSCFHKIVRIKNSDIQIYGCDLVVKTITDAETKLMLPFSFNYEPDSVIKRSTILWCGSSRVFFLVNFSHSEIKSSSDSFTALSQKIAIIVQGNICCINWVINYTVNHSYICIGTECSRCSQEWQCNKTIRCNFWLFIRVNVSHINN